MADPSNTSFIPGTDVQYAIDSTSLGLLKECGFKYYLSIVLGYQPRAQSVHLTFGTLYHAACERYDHARAQGKPHDKAQIIALRYALEETWDQTTDRPWASDHSSKNRETLIRTVAWYLDQFSDDPLETVILADGKPAVELSFRFNTHYKLDSGQPYILCGHLDRVVTFQGHTYISDKKTTSSTLSQDFFDKFSPDNQFTLYALASKVIYATPVVGLIVDAAQVAVSFSRFQRGFVPRHESVLEEWYKDLGWYLVQAEAYAKANYWPRNDKSCGSYGGCPFRPICAKPPESREEWLKAGFSKRVWNPLVVRGDI